MSTFETLSRYPTTPNTGFDVMSYRPIVAILPDVEALLSLEPEELAGVVLEHLLSIPASHGDINRYNFSLAGTCEGYPQDRHQEVARALMEAWVWLEREGFLAPKPGTTGEWVFITRRGREAGNTDGLAAYRSRALLPSKQLQPEISIKSTSAFLRGEYDTAVFQAFKELEVRIREAGNFTASEYGVELARRAFKTQTGPLTDKTLPLAEQEALANLMAGALGSYKNPHSHRNIELTPQEAAEMVILASHLLGIVKARVAARDS